MKWFRPQLLPMDLDLFLSKHSILLYFHSLDLSYQVKSLALFTQSPHYCHSCGSPIPLHCLFTQSQAAHLKDEPLCNSHRKPAPQILKSHDGTCHDDDICVFFKVFPRCPPVNLNTYPLTVYNHMDDVNMFQLRSWPTRHPRKLHCSLYITYNIIAISKLDVVWLPHLQAIFWGKVHWGLSQEGWPSQIFFNTNTQWVKVFYWTEMGQSVGRTGRRTDNSPCITGAAGPHLSLLCGGSFYRPNAVCISTWHRSGRHHHLPPW